ncbi:MAG: cysteine hydrolase [bacterium]|nr:MAG: cysteine hydrolase [bacterium]
MGAGALLVIDMINDFLLPGAPLEVPSGREIIPAVARRIEAARGEGTPVIYLCDNHDEDDPEFAKWPPHAVKGTPGALVVDALAPAQGDRVIAKKYYSAFFRTDLERVLEDLAVEKLTVTGVLTDICVLFTCADAFMRGYGLTVPQDCVAALSQEDHRFALKQIQRLMEAEIV